MGTKTITINIDEEVLAKLRRMAEHEKRKKGFLGRAISNAVREYLKEQEQERIAERQLAKMEKGYKMGKLLTKHRDELYDR